MLIHGPRQCGKTTLARKIGIERGYAYLSFDDVNLVAAARTDPAGFVDRLPDRVVLDEVQRVPELFTSIKLGVDQDREPGRFLLTGSANVLLIPRLSDSLTGRMEILNLRPLARCEIEGGGTGILPRILRHETVFPSDGKLGPKLAGVVCAGGFPEPLVRKSAARRNAWYRNYQDTLVQKDVREMARISSLESIPAVLKLSAVQSGQLLNISTIAAPFHLTRQTVTSYFTLLQRLFLVELLPAWHPNQTKRLVKTPKLHLTDTGLASAMLGVDAEHLESDRATLGHLLETFVYNELTRQASWCEPTLRFFHFRDKDQYEVDIVMEQPDGGVFGIEVKSAATVQEKDFRGLKRLRSTARGRWKSGIVFYDGEMTLSFGEGLLAVPVSALWGTAES